MKIRPEGAKLFHVGGGRTDGHDEAFRNFVIARKKENFITSRCTNVCNKKICFEVCLELQAKFTVCATTKTSRYVMRHNHHFRRSIFMLV